MAHIDLFGQLGLTRLWHSLEHLPGSADQPEIYDKLFKPGGALYVTVPNVWGFGASYHREL